MASGLQKLTSNVDDDNLCKNFMKIQTGDEVFWKKFEETRNQERMRFTASWTWKVLVIMTNDYKHEQQIWNIM